MKKTLLIFIFMIFGLTLFAESDGTTIDLFVDAKWYDATSDNNGTIHLLWITDSGGVNYGQIENDTVVNKEHIAVAGGVATKKFRPRLNVRPDGKTVHFCWRAPYPGASTHVVHCWRDENGVWDRETIHTAPRTWYIAYPSIAVDLTGVVHFVGSLWEKGGDDISIIYARKVNGTWINYDATLAPPTVNHGHSNMCTDSKGGIHAVWSVAATSLVYRYCPSGGSLFDNDNVDVPRNGSLKTEHSDVFVDRQDNVHLVALAYGKPSTRSAADYTSSPIGGLGFFTPVHASIGYFDVAFHHITYPMVVAVSKERVYVSWAIEQENGKVNLVRLSTFKDGMWNVKTLATQATIDKHGKTALAVSNSHVYVIWRNRNYQLTMYKESTGMGVTINLSPLNGNKVCGNTTISVEAPVSEEVTISNIELYINGSLATTSTSASFDYEWDASSIGAGASALIRAVATFSNAETAEYEVTVVRDCPPSIAITEPLDNSTVSVATEIKTEVTDDIGVNKVEFFIDNILKHTTTTQPYTYTWDPAQNGIEKTYNLLAKAYDTGSQTNQDEVAISYRKIFPPRNASGEKKINRSLFVVEYANVLTWESNPQNSIHNITHYRIYQSENGARTLLAEVDANTFSYRHRNLEKDRTYSYAISAVRGGTDEGGYALVVVD